MSRGISKNEIVLLEALVDAIGLSDVVAELSNIASRKAKAQQEAHAALMWKRAASKLEDIVGSLPG